MMELLAFIAWLIDLVIFIIFLSAIMSWLIVFNVVSRHNTVVYTLYDTLNRLTEPLLRPIRRRMPAINGVDLSPLVLIVILYFIKWVVITNLAKIFH